MEDCRKELVDVLLQLAQKNFQSGLLERVVERHEKYSTCLLAFAQQIVELMPLYRNFTLCHKHYYSHAALLALALAKEEMGTVRLITHGDSLKGISYMLADEKELDRVSHIQESLAKEGVQLVNLTQLHTLQANTEETITIVDLLGCSPLDYLPTLLHHAATLRNAKKLLIYHSHLQTKEIQHLCRLLNLDCDSPPLKLQLSPTHPRTRTTYKDPKELQTSIIDFIRTDALNAQKLDLIIFYPLKATLPKFLTKLREALFKLALKDHANLLHTKGQTAHPLKNNLFITSSTAELDEWNYDYSKVIAVVDFAEEFYYEFNYATGCYVERIGQCSLGEKLRRMGRVAVDRVGLYSCLENKGDGDLHYANHARELSTYVVRMIAYGGIAHLLGHPHPRINDCLQYLQFLGIISKEQGSYCIPNPQYVTLAQQGIPPIQAKLFLQILEDPSLPPDQRKLYLNLAAMSSSAIKSQGNLRLLRQQFEGSHVKPYAVWRKSGYIESCLEILTKCELIEFRKSAPSKSHEFRRKFSHPRPNPHNQKKIHFEDMEICDLVREYTVNQEVLHCMRDEVQNYRDRFEIQPLPILLTKEHINKLLAYLIKANPTCVSYFSGSKTKDYVLGKTAVPVSESSLMAVLNQKPEYILITKMEHPHHQQPPHILLSNALPEELYTEHFGHTPINRKASRDLAHETLHEQLEARIIREEFELPNISSAILQELIQNDTLIQDFDRDNHCHVYLNLELCKVLVQCFQEVTDFQLVKHNFTALRDAVHKKCAAITKYVHYMGSISLVLGQGGKIIELIEKGYVNKVYLTKLPKQFPAEYLEVVLDGKIETRNIEIIEGEIFELHSSAIVEFYSRKDCESFQRYYSRHLQKEKYFECQEVTEELEKEFNKKRGRRTDHESLSAQDCVSYLQFKWFIWKSHGKAQVTFKEREAAACAVEGLTNNPQLDGSKVKVALSANPLAVDIQNLSVYTDEAYLEQALRCYGDIKQVQILKTPLKQTARDHQHIKYLIEKSSTAPSARVDYFLQPIQKKQHGLRICKVQMSNIDQMNIICTALNQSINTLGEARLHVQTYFEDLIIMPEDSLSIYLQLLEETLAEIDNPHVTSQIRQTADHAYLVLKCGLKDSLDVVSRKFKQKLRGFNIAIPNECKNIILNETGITNLLDLQEKYHCKFTMSIITKSLRVLARKDQITAIQAEINERLNDHFFYRASISSKHYKAFKEHPEKIAELQTKFDLRMIELDEESRALLMEGNAVQINHLLNRLFERVQKNEGEQEIGENDCHICGSGIEQAYRLQCSHRFCRQCLQQLLRYSISDASLFPFKCPDLNCREQIQVIDLQNLLEYSDWLRLRSIALNEYLKKHEEYMYCLTAGCEQINRIKVISMNGLNNDHIRCEICKGAFCVKCYGAYHPARTCKQAKMSEDQLLSIYMKAFNVRKCANPKCRVLAERYTGCYKVQCTRCSTCMCFKCPANEMQPFSSAEECYRHLTQVHGGYF